MKKLLILASVITFSIMTVSATEVTKPVQCGQKNITKACPVVKPDVNKKVEFKNRLNLTEEQIQKADKLKSDSRTKMQPLMKQIKEKRIAIYELKKSDIPEIEKQKQLQKLKKELTTLDKKAKQLRTKNMKDFEKILTKDQKAELAKIKAEGRKNFAKKHQPRPFGYEINRPHPGSNPVLPKETK